MEYKKSPLQQRIDNVSKKRGYSPEKLKEKATDALALGAALIPLAIIAILIIGEIKCIYKAINCNWEPVDKAEIIYTGAALTGLGSIVGWFDIEDK